MTTTIHFDRRWRVRVDTFETTDLDVSFSVEKTVKRSPNKCTLKIYNLTRDQRGQLEALSVNRARGRGRIRVEIEAGYVNAMSLIFRGDLRNARTERDGGDRVTILEGDDGGRSMLVSRVNRAFAPGTSVETVIRACATALGVGAGNVSEAVRNARFENGSNVYAEGTTLSGSAARELEYVLRSIGCRYSVQNGALQILRRGRGLAGTAFRLGAGSGLIDVPQKNVDGTVSAEVLLIPDLVPGRRVLFETEELRGLHRVEKINYEGETFGQAWSAKLECRRLG